MSARPTKRSRSHASQPGLLGWQSIEMPAYRFDKHRSLRRANIPSPPARLSVASATARCMNWLSHPGATDCYGHPRVLSITSRTRNARRVTTSANSLSEIRSQTLKKKRPPGLSTRRGSFYLKLVREEHHAELMPPGRGRNHSRKEIYRGLDENQGPEPAETRVFGIRWGGRSQIVARTSRQFRLSAHRYAVVDRRARRSWRPSPVAGLHLGLHVGHGRLPCR